MTDNARQCVLDSKVSRIASVTPWKINPMPMAATKNPTMRVAASMPRGPMRPKIMSASASVSSGSSVGGDHTRHRGDDGRERIGFSLFMPSSTASPATITDGADEDIAFVPLAMPLMFGPGAIATVLGMACRRRSAPC